MKADTGESLSARRAWIEIGLSFARKIRYVASLSARRAWIEIRQQPAGDRQRTVALRKESVDRNVILLVVLLSSICRSPQGERG